MDTRDAAAEPERPLDLAPARFSRAGRAPYAVIDIGSNSVRIVVYDELGRAPFPRFNEKALCQLGEGFARTGALAPEGGCPHACRRAPVPGDRRCHVGRPRRRARHRGGAQRQQRSGTRRRHRRTDRPCRAGAHRRGGSLFRGARRDFRLLPPHRSGGRHGRRQSGVGRCPPTTGSARAASACRSARCRCGRCWRRVRRRRRRGSTRCCATACRKTPPRRSLPSAAAGARLPRASGGQRGAGAGGAWLYRAGRRDTGLCQIGPELSPAKLAALPGLATRRAGSLRAAALVLDRLLKRLRSDRVVFSMLGVREGWLYEQLSVAERYLDPLVEGAQAFGFPFARVPAFAAALALWTASLFPDETAAEQRLRVAACALSDYAWRDDVGVRAVESYRRLLQFPLIGIDHAERVFIAAAIHSRYGGAADDPALAPAITLPPPAQRRRALILGRAMQLGYRISGGVPEILASARLQIDDGVVRLRVRPTARVPESEVVNDRLRLLANAVGAKRIEIVESG